MSIYTKVLCVTNLLTYLHVSFSEGTIKSGWIMKEKVMFPMENSKSQMMNADVSVTERQCLTDAQGKELLLSIRNAKVSTIRLIWV